ncbi:FliH/SctL family protein [Desulfobotulus sp. H1]|uniref:Flagellar assembly protein FliH n=1 Tax=Desulfobotulus pelophilus TaxID=2823377 RepID=A0ABT3N8N5_9BACT|nr:FliH/SctL family protein [Desulfobotulus pelophilus]MCW7753821.1 FliH/SctL family protein [Desulfobotulus pelophilus]
MSDKEQNGEEGWEQMDVGRLRRFVREEVPLVRPPEKDSGEEDPFTALHKNAKPGTEGFRAFAPRGPSSAGYAASFPEKGATGPVSSGKGGGASAGFRPSFQPPSEEGKGAVPEEGTVSFQESPSGEQSGEDFSSEKRATLKKEAEQKGYADGLARGRADGQKEGYAAGHSEGLAAGREEGLAQGAAEGYDKGYGEGREAGLAELESRARELGELVFSMRNQWPDILGRYEKEVVSLAVEIAETLVFGTLPVDGAVVERAVISALHRLPDPLKVSVAVNPEDFQLVEMARERLFEAVPELRQLDIAADPGISRGGCRVSAASGSIREDLKQRMAVLKETLIMAADSRGG